MGILTAKEGMAIIFTQPPAQGNGFKNFCLENHFFQRRQEVMHGLFIDFFTDSFKPTGGRVYNIGGGIVGRYFAGKARLQV